MMVRLASTCAGATQQSMQEIFYKSKTSSRFPNLDASDVWQMGQNSQEDFFLGHLRQVLLLDFATWIGLTSNTDISIISAAFEVSEHILAFLKHVDDLRVYQGFVMPLNHLQGTLKQCLRY